MLNLMRRGRTRSSGLIVATLVLALGAGVAPANARPAPIAAAKPRAVTVTNRVSTAAMLAGGRVTVSGWARGGVSGTPAVLQRAVGKTWAVVKTSRLDSRLRYTFSVVPPAGSPTYRVVVPAHKATKAVKAIKAVKARKATKKHKAVKARKAVAARKATPATATGISPSRRLLVEQCAPATAPTATTAAWFTRPGLTTTSPISTNLGKLFCTAAPGSSIHIAMYFITTGSREVEPILHALQVMHRYRNVNVQFVLEGKHYDSVWGRDSLKRMRGIGTVSLCQWSCRSERANAGVQHQKFIVMSDTTMRAGVDPVLVSSSANWSHTQLRGMWQSAQVLYSDPTLAREFDIRFASMQACATQAGCASWKRQYAGKALPADVYSLVPKNLVWTDASLAPRSGSAGRGTSVLLSPMTAGPDPLLSQLENYSCTAAHHTVRIAMLKVQATRASTLANTVRGLLTRGCQVQLLLAVPPDKIAAGGLAALTQQAVSVRCVSGLHEKAVLVDGVDRSTRALRTVLWAGSQNLTTAAVSYNDDASVRMVLQEARGSFVPAMSAMWKAYLADWNAMSRTTTSCTGSDWVPEIAKAAAAAGEPLLGLDG